MLAALLVASLLTASAPASPAPARWAISSANTEVAVEEHAVGRGCRVVARRGSTELWSIDRCVGERGDYRFVSNDGQVLLVFFSLPQVRGGLGKVKVGERYRSGQVERSFRLGQFVVDSKRLVKTRKHLYWLEGALGQPGVPPGLAKSGKAVELTTLDGRACVVGFDGRVKVPPSRLRKSRR